MVKLLATTKAHVALGQEHRLKRGEEIDQASSWCCRNGWKCAFSPALDTQAGSTSAGVCVLVRDFLGLHLPRGGGEISPGRVIACEVHLPRGLHFLACSVYLYHAEQLSE
eukprot:6561390-Pyramimonas_sp.AAC.1